MNLEIFLGNCASQRDRFLRKAGFFFPSAGFAFKKTTGSDSFFEYVVLKGNQQGNSEAFFFWGGVQIQNHTLW